MITWLQCLTEAQFLAKMHRWNSATPKTWTIPASFPSGCRRRYGHFFVFFCIFLYLFFFDKAARSRVQHAFGATLLICRQSQLSSWGLGISSCLTSPPVYCSIVWVSPSCHWSLSFSSIQRLKLNVLFHFSDDFFFLTFKLRKVNAMLSFYFILFYFTTAHSIVRYWQRQYVLPPLLMFFEDSPLEDV